MEAIAKLNNVPTSPRKMRLIADLIRGKEVDMALNILKFDSKIGSKKMEKLLLSAIANWQDKNKNESATYEVLAQREKVHGENGWEDHPLWSGWHGRLYNYRR